MHFGFFDNDFDSFIGYSDPVFTDPGTEACARTVREAALQNWANYITPITTSKHQAEHQGLFINSVVRTYHIFVLFFFFVLIKAWTSKDMGGTLKAISFYEIKT